jgi:hypothetical protein
MKPMRSLPWSWAVLAILFAACSSFSTPRIIIVTPTDVAAIAPAATVFTPTEPAVEAATVSVIAAATATPASSARVPRADGPLLLEDVFEGPVPHARQLFGEAWMSFVLDEGAGKLTGLDSGVVLPAMYPAPLATDFNAEFDFLPERASPGSAYGLIFRSDDEREGLAYYHMVVIQPEEKISRVQTWKNGDWVFEQQFTLTPDALLPEVPNRVRLEVDGPEVRVFLNGKWSFDCTIQGPESAGIFGLALVPGEAVPDAVYFDNLRVYAPGGSAPPPASLPTSTPAPAAVSPTHTAAAPTASPTRTAAAPTPSPTRTITPPPAASASCPTAQESLLFYDDFTNPASGWTEYRGEDYDHFYKSGEFHMRVTKLNSTGNAWMLIRDQGMRYRLQVRAWRLEGPDVNSYGLIFGGQNDDNYSIFRISDSGSYQLAKQLEGQWQELIPWTKTPLVNKGASNLLGLIVDGPQVVACLNGQQLTTVIDPALKSGRVGLVTGAYDAPVHIHFDEFGDWKLEGPVIFAGPPPSSQVPAPPAPDRVLPSGPPGVYVASLRPDPSSPQRGKGVRFIASFANTAGAAKEFDWLVMIYQPDRKKAFGETGVTHITVPPGFSEIGTPDNWRVTGPGGCLPFYAQAYFQNTDNSRVQFQNGTGGVASPGFQVCP